jgi:hypothetical protein
MKKANQYSFDFATKLVKRNGRKFGKILHVDTQRIYVLITTKQHEGFGETMTFQVVQDEGQDNN